MLITSGGAGPLVQGGGEGGAARAVQGGGEVTSLEGQVRVRPQTSHFTKCKHISDHFLCCRTFSQLPELASYDR